MSKDILTVPENKPKFTKGEKCIFSHLVLTFTLILILVIIYGIHLYMVRHTLYGIFKTRRSSVETQRKSGSENLLVGYLYLNATITKLVCNTLLLKARWSISTAHCVAVRTDPDMAHLLFAWRLKYRLVSENITGQKKGVFVTSIKKSIVHSLFERETFANNVGLIEHTETYPIEIPDLNYAEVTLPLENRNNIFIIGWNHSEIEIPDTKTEPLSNSYDATHVSADYCSKALAPVAVVRNYELCITLQNEQQIFLDYGAVVFVNSKLIGIFSWGERLQQELPMVIINITFFQDWLRIMVS